MGESRRRVEARYEVTYHPSAEEDLARIDRAWLTAIRNAIEGKLMTYPERYGKPLRENLVGCWKLRVGDYRIVFQIIDRTVRVIAVIHRSGGYGRVDSRL